MKKLSWLIAVFAILALIFGGLISCDNNSGAKVCSECGENPCICSVATLTSVSIKGAIATGAGLGTPVDGWDATKGKVAMHPSAAAATNTSISGTTTNPNAAYDIYVFTNAAELTAFNGEGLEAKKYTANAAVAENNVIVFVVTSADGSKSLTYAIEVEFQSDITLTVADHVNGAENPANVFFYIGQSYYSLLLLHDGIQKSTLDAANAYGLTLAANGKFDGSIAGDMIVAIEYTGTAANSTIVAVSNADVELSGNFNDIAAINNAIAEAAEAALEDDPDATEDDQKLLHMSKPGKKVAAGDIDSLAAGLIFNAGKWADNLGDVIIYGDTVIEDNKLVVDTDDGLTVVFGTPVDMTGKSMLKATVGTNDRALDWGYWSGGSLIFLGTADSGEETVSTDGHWGMSEEDAEGEYPLSTFAGEGADISKLIRVIIKGGNTAIDKIELAD